MSQVANRKSKLYFGMTVFQIGVLFFLGLMACGFIGLVGFFIINNRTSNGGIFSTKLLSPSQAINGRWEKYIQPTPTPTMGATPTPIVLTNLMGTPRVITPAAPVQIRIGCDFGYPPNIEFFHDGTYVGASASMFSGIFLWQGGQFEILDNSRIKMQTRNGFAVYQLLIEGDQLKFTDDSKCELIYRKVK